MSGKATYSIGDPVAYVGPTLPGPVEVKSGDKGIINNFVPNAQGGNDLEVALEKGITVTKPVNMWKSWEDYESDTSFWRYIIFGAVALGAVGAWFYFSADDEPPLRAHLRSRRSRK